MPAGTPKVAMFGRALVPGGTQTFNSPGTFTVPVGVTKVSVTGKGATGAPGNSGNPGNAGATGNAGSAGNAGGGAGGGAGAFADVFICTRFAPPGYPWCNYFITERGLFSPCQYNNPGTYRVGLGGSGGAGASGGNFPDRTTRSPSEVCQPCVYRYVTPKCAFPSGTPIPSANKGFTNCQWNYIVNSRSPIPGYKGNAGSSGGSGSSGSAGTSGASGNPGNAGTTGATGAASNALSQTFNGGAGGNGGNAGTGGGGGAGGNAGNGGSGGTQGNQGTFGISANNCPPLKWVGSAGVGIRMRTGGTGGNAAGNGSAYNPCMFNPNGNFTPCGPTSANRFQLGSMGGGGAGACNPGSNSYMSNYNNPIPNCCVNPEKLVGGAGGSPGGGRGGSNLIINYPLCSIPNASRPGNTYAADGGNATNPRAGGGGGGSACSNTYGFVRGGGGGGGGRGNAGNPGNSGAAGNPGNPGNAGNAGSAATPSTVSCISVTPGSPYPITVGSPGGQIVINWNPQ